MAALLCAGEPKRAERDSGIKGNHDSQYQCHNHEYQCHKNGVATDEKISSEATSVGNTPDRKW
jgi:hypothetical protein